MSRQEVILQERYIFIIQVNTQSSVYAQDPYRCFLRQISHQSWFAFIFSDYYIIPNGQWPINTVLTPCPVLMTSCATNDVMSQLNASNVIHLLPEQDRQELEQTQKVEENAPPYYARINRVKVYRSWIRLFTDICSDPKTCST